MFRVIHPGKIVFEDLGLIPYRDAWRYQESLRAKRIKGEIPDTFIFCEHPPVFTMGRQDCLNDLRCDPKDVIKKGFDVVKSDRGGRITYHGPGQIIGYLIFDIGRRGYSVKDFVWRVECVLMEVLSRFGIETVRDPDNPGVWVGGNKIAALGLNISRNVSIHGFALNYDPDMEHYKYIVPCGIKERGVTSMKRLLGQELPPVQKIKDAIKEIVLTIFQ